MNCNKCGNKLYNYQLADVSYMNLPHDMRVCSKCGLMQEIEEKCGEESK